jgi:hypothetical protein
MSAATFDVDLVCTQLDFFTNGSAWDSLWLNSSCRVVHNSLLWGLGPSTGRSDRQDLRQATFTPRKRDLLETQPLGRRSGSSGLFQNLHRLAHLRDSEDQEGRVGVGFGSAVTVVDVDTRIAEPRSGTPQLPGTMGKFDLRNFGLFVITALAVENGLGFGRGVHNETDGALSLLVRELLICVNVDPSSARAWQSLPSVPGLSSRLIVNSFAVGMLSNLL